MHREPHGGNVRRHVRNDAAVRRSKAIATKRAAACLPADSMCKIYVPGMGIGFGYVPPPAIPIEEVFWGLPEPDMIVTNC